MGRTPEETKRVLEALYKSKGLSDEHAIAKAGAQVMPSNHKAAAAPRGQSGGKETVKRSCKDGDLKAPYRFVALNERVAWVEDGEITPLDEPLANGCRATIDVTWAAETPLLIGAPRQKARDNVEAVGPLRLGETVDYVVPGASLKGMLRSALETVAFGRLHPINGHHAYGLRDFEHPGYKSADPTRPQDQTAQRFPVSKVDKVMAGWLRAIGQGKDRRYELVPCNNNWRQILITDLLSTDWLKKKPNSAWEWASDKPMVEKYKCADMHDGKLFDFGITRKFKPSVDHNGKATVAPDENGGVICVPVFSDRVPMKERGQSNWEKSGKKVEYAFPDTGGDPITLTWNQFAAFELIHSKPSKNKPQPDGSWKVLKPTLEAGRRIPVFYVGDPSGENPDAPFAMGLTRLFKVPHRYSVGEVAKRSGECGARPTREKVDFVENLFGYVLEEDEFDVSGDKAPKAIARKGRVAFSFGKFLGAVTEDQESVPTIMMGPRASFAPFYLRGEYKDWSDEKATLSGRKRYLPRYPRDRLKSAAKEIKDRLRGQVTDALRGKNDIQTDLRFLLRSDGRELRFTSTIRLHNVSPAELGAVLWVLTHGGQREKYRHMLGRAKAFGAGQVRVHEVRLRVKPNDGSRVDDAAPTPYLEAFERLMEAKVGPEWKSSPTVREYLACCRPANGAKLAKDGHLEYVPTPKQFQTIRKMTKLGDGNPCFGEDWSGRYLETPDDGD